MKKICSKCKKLKSVSEFCKRKDSIDGYRGWCRECLEKYHIKYNIENKEGISTKKKIYYQENKEVRLNYSRDNRDHINERRRIQVRERYQNDISYRIATTLRSELNHALKGNHKCARTMELLDCDIDFFKKHVESLFQPSMSWENYGDWEIDHILPVTAFELQNSEEQEICFAWWNMQPLWEADNREKYNKLDWKKEKRN